MSNEDQIKIEKKIEQKFLVRDIVKNGGLAVILWILWGAYEKKSDDIELKNQQQFAYTVTRIRDLEGKVDDCHDERESRVEQGVNYLIKQLTK